MDTKDVHLTKADWIGLDGRNAQSVYRFSNHQIQANPLHPSLILEDGNHLLGFMLQIHIDVVYLCLISHPFPPVVIEDSRNISVDQLGTSEKRE
jgi:hypothetical protein